MVNDFVGWLNQEIQKRGWTNNELARRAGLTSATVSLVLTGKNEPGIAFCNGVAIALSKPAEDVFRVARLLPPLPGPDVDRDPTLQELISIAKNMPQDERDDLLAYARFRYQRSREKATPKKE